MSMVLDGGQVFVSGVADIGLGTTGLGAAAAGSAQQSIAREHMEEYWKYKRELAATRLQIDETQRQKLLALNDMSPRKRLEFVLENRREEIKVYSKVQKATEKQAKEKRLAEEAVVRKLLAKERDSVMRYEEERRRHRETVKVREMEVIKADREEMLESDQAERVAVQQVRKDRIVALRAYHEVSKARAQEEAEVRRLERIDVVKAIKEKQARKKELIIVEQEAIVELKKELVVGVHKARHADQVIEDNEEGKHVFAQSVKKAIEQRAAAQKETIAARRAERCSSARRKREVAAERQAAYLEAKEKQKVLLLQQARAQRDVARVAIQEEKDEKRRAHLEYTKMMQELAEFRSVDGPKATVGKAGWSDVGRKKARTPGA
jgi:hypothetical protein